MCRFGVGCVCDTPTGNQCGPPSTSFSLAKRPYPSGVRLRSARYARLHSASPRRGKDERKKDNLQKENYTDAQGEMGPMQCGTKMSKTTEASCVASGCDSCEQQSATEYLFCTDTTDNVACWRTPCERFTATYQRRTGECDGDCVCQFGEWVDVTTTFDHTNTTDECGT